MSAPFCHPERSEGSVNISGSEHAEIIRDVSLSLNMTIGKSTALIAVAPLVLRPPTP
jgi:hypothetical protein